jgi:precorrin-2/cobalt-factor-2 C20-methyltransferase
METMNPGTLYGIGVGPGDPELLTAKALRLLGALPVLAWPAPLNGVGMARTIAAPFIPGGRTEIPIRLSFRPGREDTATAYGAAADHIAAHLEAGRDVGVLCEGDPLFYGSLIHLLSRLGSRFPVAIVPGVASPMAAAAAALAPLASLEDGLAIIPATKPEAAILALLEAADCAIIMKIGRHLPKVRRLLEGTGRAGDALLVERVGLPGQRIAPLDRVSDAADYFSLILVSRNIAP